MEVVGTDAVDPKNNRDAHAVTEVTPWFRETITAWTTSTLANLQATAAATQEPCTDLPAESEFTAEKITKYYVLTKELSVVVFSMTNRGRLVWAIWCWGVVVGSLLPVSAKELTHTTGTVHRAVHMVAFGGIALGAYSCPRRFAGKLVASGGVIGLGALIELLQCYFYSSAYEWADVQDDSFGVLVSVLLTMVLTVLASVARR